MKKILKPLIATLILLEPAIAQGTIPLRQLTLESMDDESTFHTYSMSEKVNAYEFTPKTASHMTCVAVVTQFGPGGLDCFEKEPRN